MENIVIIGSGPAGLTAAIYTARTGLSPVLVAGGNPGGQLVNTDMIENYPGFPSIRGSDLMMNMLTQAENLGTRIVYENVDSIIPTSDTTFNVNLSSGESVGTKTVLIATGAKHRKLDIPGEGEFTNKGVSWCATCDGPIYREKTVVVVGGGNTAVMEALFLANFAKEVILIHRRNSLRAEQFMQDRLFANNKITCIWNSEIVEIRGDNSVEEISIKNKLTGEKIVEKTSAIFIAIGTIPSSDFASGTVDIDEEGYIISIDTRTSREGIFAAGDVVSGSLKQAIYAAGQGALASKYIESYLGVR